jgi:hypothetical protein
LGGPQKLWSAPYGEKNGKKPDFDPTAGPYLYFLEKVPKTPVLTIFDEIWEK